MDKIMLMEGFGGGLVKTVVCGVVLFLVGEVVSGR